MGLLDGIRRRGIRRSLLAFGRGQPEVGRVPAPFVVGIARSGTTLLRLMLDAHRELTIPPEKAYGPAGGGHRLSGKTLVFVIDLLGVK